MRYVLKPFMRGLPVWALLAFFCTFSFGQRYLIHHYSESNGLPTAKVFGITQDRPGRIWFATQAGITVYDGVSWQNYTSADGLPAAVFSEIFADPQGRVWAAAGVGENKIHVVYHDGTFEGQWHSAGPLTTRLKTTRITSFQVMGPERQAPPVLIISTSRQGLYMRQRGKWQNITSKDGLLSDSIKGTASLDGKIYVVSDKGLSIITPGTIAGAPVIRGCPGASLGLPRGSEAIESIGIESKDKFPSPPLEQSRIWLLGRNWLGYLQGGRFKTVFYQAEKFMFMVENEVVRVMPDYRSGLYVASRHRVNYFNLRTLSWESVRMCNGLISGGANTLFIDFEKNIWIACDRGVSKISSRRFSNYQMMHGLLDDEVTAVLEYEPGKFALGHNDGITFYDDNKKKFRALPLYRDKVPVGRILEMAIDSKGNIWMPAGNSGLAKIGTRPPHQITWYDRSHGFHPYIAAVFIDRSDRVWVGTGGGIYLLKGAKAVPQLIGNSPFPPVRRLFGDSGRLGYIAGASDGLLVHDFRENRWNRFRVPDKKNANSIYAVKKTSRGQLLAGTRDGLYILENKTLKKYKLNGFQLDRPVFFIMEAPGNRFWFGTGQGVVRWDGKTRTRRHYNTHDGLTGHETNRAAVIRDSRGRVWIGTNRGVSVYDEVFDDELFNPVPKIHLLHMGIQGKDEPVALRMNRDGPVRLGSRENSLVFRFRGISFGDEAALRFKSKLEGFEKEWSEESYPYQQMSRYPNLPPGRYRFHVKVRNARGVWSRTAASPEIVIPAPFYKQWWFYLASLFTLGFILYSIVRFILEKRHALRLEREVEERTAQLQTVEKRYRNLFEESRDTVFISKPGGKFIDINPAGVELFGYNSKEELVNAPVKNVYIDPGDRLKFQETIERDGYVKDYELALKRKDGEPVTTLSTAVSVRDKEGKIVAYRGIMRDITDKKALEERLIQAQKMEAIGTLAGGIAHDFNNILGVIMGYTELSLEDLPEGHPVQTNVKQILTAAERGAELVKQILAFSRQSERKRKPLHIVPVIKESLKLLRSTLPATIEIRRHIYADGDVVLADPTQIQQVIMNLVANASHAMRKKGGLLDIALDEVYLDSDDTIRNKELKSGSYLRLAVTDTGHGIPGDLMKRIFEPFFTTKNPGEGTGMGLAVIHGIVKSHGGDISAYSEPGKGSTFHVYLPRRNAEVETRPQAKEDIPGGSERILLVDDEVTLIHVGTQMLKRLGYDVTGKSNAVEALKTIRRHPDGFDLVISDVTMPRMTGIQLAVAVKRIRPDIPFILCSGFSAAVTPEEIKTTGVSAFIVKPIIKSELARIVRKALDGTGIASGGPAGGQTFEKV